MPHSFVTMPSVATWLSFPVSELGFDSPLAARASLIVHASSDVSVSDPCHSGWFKFDCEDAGSTCLDAQSSRSGTSSTRARKIENVH